MILFGVVLIRKLLMGCPSIQKASLGIATCVTFDHRERHPMMCAFEIDSR
jgi:hypothetical protein